MLRPARKLLLAALSVLLPGTAFCQGSSRLVSIPRSSSRFSTGPIQLVSTPEDRDTLLRLLAQARENYRLHDAGRAYRLKVSFTADSGGAAQYDGPWEMEEVFAPGLGLRWAATSAAGYATTRLDVNGMSYAEGTSDTIPLSLHEARGALLGPLESPAAKVIRTSIAEVDGVPLTCVLLSVPTASGASESERSMEESEDCLDASSGLLRTHSLVPGRYAVYDYAGGPRFYGHVLPRTLTIIEAGRPVIKLRVDSLEGLADPNPALFVPTASMKAGAPATEMAGVIRIPLQLDAFDSGAANSKLPPLAVFGLLTSAGQIIGAHSLQPSDPASEAAVEAAAGLNFPSASRSGAPEQHEVILIAGSAHQP